MKYIFCIISLLIFSQWTFAQIDTSSTAKNIFYVEAAGIGGFGSINYERIITGNKFLICAFRVGFSTNNINDFTDHFNPDFLIPFSINGCFGKNHKIELGIGQTFANIIQADFNDLKPKRTSTFHTNFTIGYRYQKNRSGIIFRCGYTPIIEMN